jgi:hypothetical protein
MNSRASKKKKVTYPEKTNGSELAAEVRSKANQLSEEERESLLELGKELIYGGSSAKEKIRARH